MNTLKIPLKDRAQCSRTLRNGEQCKNKVGLGDLDFCSRHKPFSTLEIVYDESSSLYVAGQNVSAEMASEEPNFCFEQDSDALYTLVMYDPDAPVAKAKGNQYLHWLLVNIYGQSQDVIQKYMGPAPPPKSGVHHYIFGLYRQNGEIDPKDLKDKYADRSNFEIDRFVHKYNLDLVEKVFFTVSS